LKFLLLGANIGINYGCDAIVLGTEQIINRCFPDSEVFISNWSWRARKPSDILGNNSKIIVKNVWKNVLYLSARICEKAGLLKSKEVRLPKRLIKELDCILSIGGDLYTVYGPFPYAIIEPGNKIIRSGKPYIIWCASIGPLEKTGKRLDEVVKHLKSCKAIIVREHDSYYYMRETLGLKDNVYLAADPAFLVEPEPSDFPFLKKQRADKLLAINFTLDSMRYVYGNMQVEKFQAELVFYVQQILDSIPIMVLFVPHVKTDNKFLRPIFEKVSKHYPERIGILPDNIGAAKTKWVVSQANALLTMRFHCALAGFSTNTPTMILTSAPKGGKICKEMYGHLEYSLNIGDMNVSILVSKLKNLLDNEDVIRKQLKPVCEEMKRRALGAGDILSKVL